MMADASKWVAVLGGARRYDKAQLHAAYRCGAELARHGRGIITGATTGVPYAAALGVMDEGGFVVGISPASSAAEHVGRFGKPLTAARLVIYSGLGVEGRGPLILRSAGAAIFIGGEMGTLAEFAAGWLCGCPYLGLLEGVGGITADLRRIAVSVETTWGSTVVCSSEPTALAAEICRRLDATAPQPEDGPTLADVTESIAELRPC